MPNVVATKVGRVQPDSVYVICAHYDATSENSRYDTPGADDNGTGTVAVLTAARLLSAVATDYTVKFVLFAGEEQGLVGSGYWVADMAAAGLPILGALNFDMIGWWTGGVPFDLEIETNENSRWLADAICWAADTYTTMPYILHVDDSAYWGDFYRFWQHGFAAVNHEESWDWYDPDFNPVLPLHRRHRRTSSRPSSSRAARGSAWRRWRRWRGWPMSRRCRRSRRRPRFRPTPIPSTDAW